MRAVIYGAKSTEDTHGSIGTQLADCRALAEREGWTVIGEFHDEAFSAYKGNRGPGLEAAKTLAAHAAAEDGRCVLVAQDADRFARGAGDAPGAADHLGEVYFSMSARASKSGPLARATSTRCGPSSRASARPTRASARARPCAPGSDAARTAAPRWAPCPGATRSSPPARSTAPARP